MENRIQESPTLSFLLYLFPSLQPNKRPCAIQACSGSELPPQPPRLLLQVKCPKQKCSWFGWLLPWVLASTSQYF